MPNIVIPAQNEQIETAMAFFQQHMEKEHESLFGFVELAVEELLVNVILYAYPPDYQPAPGIPEDRRGKVELGFRWVSMDDKPYICVWVRDWGVPYDPFREAPTPDISLDVEDRPIGGLGVHLVRNVTNHHCYSGSDGANTIEIYFEEQA